MADVQIIDGKALAAQLREQIAAEVAAMPKKPGLAVILVGDDPASQVYVRNKITACEKTGIQSFEHRMDENSSETEIRHAIKNLNANPDVHGVLLQLPLPAHLADVQEKLVQGIAPEKDVDGLTIANAGKLFLGMKDGMVPCTPQGALHLIQSVRKDLSGLNAVVIGRSNLFGKPMAQLLLNENCTVTTAHSRTKNLPEICANADILVAAVGRPKMVQAGWIKQGAIVIDVGINRQEDGKLCGDVDFEAAKEVAGAITPVPGGVGPMTIAFLLKNTVRAAS
ncbi:MAG: bifunctional methylenetetrahydrofolate dehydrogenase/methenyltetrahydrofolate cyclohydrolase FolD [Rhodospirillales bacterium]|nr:bifunctional methylenetetrahydrofolate dehydrogenase/methenyltetrahydrofolate cyclohydrolase FolD [Alphaproteobacteria bacterium]USO02886.1 MAG: bifunctional methylenetetrahydrofolate dehydrogenase/methenyltetrahydrofolate cyclohydrolase FolD [Rhodospirillales bacterium]